MNDKSEETRVTDRGAAELQQQSERRKGGDAYWSDAARDPTARAEASGNTEVPRWCHGASAAKCQSNTN